MPSEPELAELLQRLDLAKYEKLLIEDEALTLHLLKTMDAKAARESLVEIGMDEASTQRLCSAMFEAAGASGAGGAGDDDDDDDALQLEDNDDDDDAIELEDNGDGAVDGDELVIEENDVKPAGVAATKPPAVAPAPAPVASGAAPPKPRDSLASRYNKWDNFEEDETMDGAVREAAEYEVVERVVYLMSEPSTSGAVLDYCKQGPATWI